MWAWRIFSICSNSQLTRHTRGGQGCRGSARLHALSPADCLVMFRAQVLTDIPDGMCVGGGCHCQYRQSVLPGVVSVEARRSGAWASLQQHPGHYHVGRDGRCAVSST